MSLRIKRDFKKIELSSVPNKYGQIEIEIEDDVSDRYAYMYLRKEDLEQIYNHIGSILDEFNNK